MQSLPIKSKLFLSVGLLSAAILSFQIVLIQILSIVQWHHFAYMVISIALLGFGAAGTMLAIFRQRLMQHNEILLPVFMITSGLAIALVTEISQMSCIRFDSYLLFAEYSHLFNLLITYLLFFIPFFLAALAVGLIFIKYVDDIGRIYFANLVGSGIGGLLGLALIWLLFPAQLPSLISIFPILAGVLILPDKKKIFISSLAVTALAIAVWKIVIPPELIVSQYKDLSKTLQLPEAKVNYEKNSPYGFIQVVTSPVLRYAPGLSLTAKQTSPVRAAVFTNADWFGVITARSEADTFMVLDYTTFALPYAVAKRKNVLVLKAGTGMEVVHALSRGAEKVVAVEPNSEIISALKKEIAGMNDSLFYNPKIFIHSLEPRTFLLRDTALYDLIVLPVVGAFGGVAGMYALHEQFILTKEAFGDMWHKLSDHGAISITSWLDYPARNPLKILATMVEALEELNIRDPHNHIAAVRSWGTITFILSKAPFAELEIGNIKAFCDEMMFDPTLLPGIKNEERAQYNQLEDIQFFSYLDQLFSDERNSLYNNYDFNIKPATDNKPYFSQFIRWKSLPQLAGSFGNRSLPFFEIGYLLVIITLIQIAIVSFLLIILPLFRLGWKGKNKLNIVLYFGGIGLGYMFVEMVFIQRFILYFGNPVYAASTVITSLLIFSGVGSFNSNYFMKRKKMVIVLSLIVGILLIYSVILTPILQQTIHLIPPFKMLIVLFLIAPLAFCMGLPFPTGLTQVSKLNIQEISWAWGINGCVSVISTALATLIAVEFGFHWVMVISALAYCVPLAVWIKWS